MTAKEPMAHLHNNVLCANEPCCACMIEELTRKLNECERDLKEHMEQIKFVVKTCMDSREQSTGVQQAAYLRDEILTRVDPDMMIGRRVIDDDVPNDKQKT